MKNMCLKIRAKGCEIRDLNHLGAFHSYFSIVIPGFPSLKFINCNSKLTSAKCNENHWFGLVGSHVLRNRCEMEHFSWLYVQAMCEQLPALV